MILDGPILVVDDDEAVRTITVELLMDAGLLALEAASANEALALLRSNCPIDLLLTDIVMPGMNGIELAAAAQAMRPGLRVLFMTGYARYVPPLGARMLRKPFTADELVASVTLAHLDPGAAVRRPERMERNA
jgi:CheY-like chemotaxis protein